MTDMTQAAGLADAAKAAETNAAISCQPVTGFADETANHYRFLADIPVRLSVEVGAVSLKLSEIMDLEEGSVVELGRQATDLLDINVNGTLVARGEVVTIDGRFGIRVAEVISNQVAGTKVERRA
ncbi:MAG: flagellar motor switch protein FliN [Sphingomonadaceae bacterium]